MIHAQRSPGHSYCGLVQVAAVPDMENVTCGECLWHIATEAMEGTGGELEALEAVRLIAQLAHPHLTITVTVSLAARPYTPHA